MALTNYGLIQATETEPLTIDVTDAYPFTNEGTLRAIGSGGLKLADSTFTNAGQVEILLGSKIEAAGDYVQTTGNTSLQGGTLQLLSGSSLVDIQGGTITGNGIITGDLNIDPDGIIDLGTSPGQIEIDGDYSQTGTLQIDIAGANAVTGYDVVDISGYADLDGTLEINLSGGYFPTYEGQSFEIMTFASRSGEFNTVNGLDLGSGAYFELVYADASVTLVAHDVNLPVIVLSPNGGEYIAAGSTYPIEWTTTPSEDINSVFIEYSIDNGQSWDFADTNAIDNTGSYNWLVPDVNSAECLINVSDSADPAKTDMSNSTFTIYPCQRQLPTDFNKDCYIDFRDFAFFAETWLQCGNPYDSQCGQ